MSSPQTRIAPRKRNMLAMCVFILAISTSLMFLRYPTAIQNDTSKINAPVFDPNKPLPAAISTDGLTYDYTFTAGLTDSLVIAYFSISILCLIAIAVYTMKTKALSRTDDNRALLYSMPLLSWVLVVVIIGSLVMMVTVTSARLIQTDSKPVVEQSVADWAKQRYGIELSYSTDLLSEDARISDEEVLILPEHRDAVITLDDGRKVMFEINYRSDAPDVADAQIILIDASSTELPVVND